MGACLEAPAEGLQRGRKVLGLAMRAHDQDGVHDGDAERLAQGHQHQRGNGLPCGDHLRESDPGCRACSDAPHAAPQRNMRVCLETAIRSG